MLSYRIRAPEGYKSSGSKKWPCILILHGMNMNAEAYVNTLASGTWKDLAKEYIILGINGERPSYIGKTPKPKHRCRAGKGSDPSFNYTYVNWMGKSTYKGYPNTHQARVPTLDRRRRCRSCRRSIPISKYFLGGHSQGGYLTYVMLMHFPELIAGAFPIAGGVIIQAEPDVFEDETLLKQQRETPLVIVHSRTDPNVNFSATTYARERFSEEGWGAFQVLDPEQGGHMFGLLPVGRAIRWLEAMSGDDAAKIHAFAERKIGEKAWGDAASALRRAITVEGGKGSAKTRELLGKVDAAAKKEAERFLSLIRKNEDGTWVDDFLTFRDQFQHAPCAAEAMAAFAALRAEHTEPAQQAYKSAREAMQRGDQDGAYGRYQEIVDSYYASPRYRMIKRWIAERN